MRWFGYEKREYVVCSIDEPCEIVNGIDVGRCDAMGELRSITVD